MTPVQNSQLLSTWPASQTFWRGKRIIDAGGSGLPGADGMDKLAPGARQSARRVLSDSGTVQDECCIVRVPPVTLRDVTERPETLECGSNMLSGCEPEAILRCVEIVLAQGRAWQPPAEYLETDVSSTVVKIVLGYRHAG